ncbi:hypothetical protein RhoFasSB10_04616 [Rhodococcus fascians]|nr:hypothetical protein [Rhodococcus fascians]
MIRPLRSRRRNSVMHRSSSASADISRPNSTAIVPVSRSNTMGPYRFDSRHRASGCARSSCALVPSDCRRSSKFPGPSIRAVSGCRTGLRRPWNRRSPPRGIGPLPMQNPRSNRHRLLPSPALPSRTQRPHRRWMSHRPTSRRWVMHRPTFRLQRPRIHRRYAFRKLRTRSTPSGRARTRLMRYLQLPWPLRSPNLSPARRGPARA